MRDILILFLAAAAVVGGTSTMTRKRGFHQIQSVQEYLSSNMDQLRLDSGPLFEMADPDIKTWIRESYQSRDDLHEFVQSIGNILSSMEADNKLGKYGFFSLIGTGIYLLEVDGEFAGWRNKLGFDLCQSFLDARIDEFANRIGFFTIWGICSDVISPLLIEKNLHSTVIMTVGEHVKSKQFFRQNDWSLIRMSELSELVRDQSDRMYMIDIAAAAIERDRSEAVEGLEKICLPMYKPTLVEMIQSEQKYLDIAWFCEWEVSDFCQVIHDVNESSYWSTGKAQWNSHGLPKLIKMVEAIPVEDEALASCRIGFTETFSRLVLNQPRPLEVYVDGRLENLNSFCSLFTSELSRPSDDRILNEFEPIFWLCGNPVDAVCPFLKKLDDQTSTPFAWALHDYVLQPVSHYWAVNEETFASYYVNSNFNEMLSAQPCKREILRHLNSFMRIMSMRLTSISGTTKAITLAQFPRIDGIVPLCDTVVREGLDSSWGFFIEACDPDVLMRSIAVNGFQSRSSFLAFLESINQVTENKQFIDSCFTASDANLPSSFNSWANEYFAVWKLMAHVDFVSVETERSKIIEFIALLINRAVKFYWNEFVDDSLAAIKSVTGLEAFCVTQQATLNNFLVVHRASGALKYMSLLCPNIPMSLEQLQEMSNALSPIPVDSELRLRSSSVFADSLDILTAQFIDPTIPGKIYIDGAEVSESEWIARIVETITDPADGLFVSQGTSTQYLTINPAKEHGFLKEFEAFGRLIALALIRHLQIPMRLPTFFFAKLLDDKVHPCDLRPEERERADFLERLVYGRDAVQEERVITFPELGGQERRVTRDNVKDVVEEVSNMYMPPWTKEVTEAIKRGLDHMVPISALERKVTPEVLKYLVLSNIN